VAPPEETFVFLLTLVAALGILTKTAKTLGILPRKKQNLA